MRRVPALILSAVLIVTPLGIAHAQMPGGCTNGTAPEETGPTDINAVTGNGGLSAALNRKGTLTVLKWPSPSFYDQLDYRTTDRSSPRMGAAPNDGAFLGLSWRKQNPGSKWHFSWLRSWPTSQRYAAATTDEIVTTHRDKDSGLEVEVRDVVAPNSDALLRWIEVTRSRKSPVHSVRVFSFANFNPMYSKTAGDPSDDWCSDDGSDQGASYLKGPDAIVHASSGVDESTGNSSRVAVVMAFDGSSDGHSVGDDPSTSAYQDAADSSLTNNGSSNSQSDAAVFDTVRFRDRDRVRSTIIFALRPSQKAALELLKSIRKSGAKHVRQAKAKWWADWLRPAPMPRRAPRGVVTMAKRSLIALRQAMDDDGLVMSSVATQTPLGLDWVRNGSYMNAALLASGHEGSALKHNRKYGQLQAKLEASTTPRGNWMTSFYADGIRGSATTHEIDSTGFGLWTLWDAFERTENVNYLVDAYEPIRRAADHLTDTCVDATNDLQCLSYEEDRMTPSQTLVGAQAVWMGLDAAAEAGQAFIDLFEHSPTKRNAWRARRNELRDAIQDEFFDQGCKCYTKNASVGGTLLWPVRMLDPGSKASLRQADLNWRVVNKAMEGEVRSGGMEARALLGNAHAWAGRNKKLAKLERALSWLAKERSTPGTGLLGGAWRVRKGHVEIMRSQPHAWHHAMYYLAALKTYGKG